MPSGRLQAPSAGGRDSPRPPVQVSQNDDASVRRRCPQTPVMRSPESVVAEGDPSMSIERRYGH